MAQILVRQIDEGLKETLRARAERKSRSLEAEVRSILADAAEADEAVHVQGQRLHSGFTMEGADAFDHEIARKRRASTFSE